MVRFARAHGSKSANERLPEEASSWQDLKQQLLDKQNAIKSDDPKEKQTIKIGHDLGKEESGPEWAEFENNLVQPSKKVKKEKNSDKSSTKTCKHGKVQKTKLAKSVKEGKKVDKMVQKLLTKLIVTDSVVKQEASTSEVKEEPLVTRVDPHSLSKRQRRKNREAMKTSPRLDSVSAADISEGVDLAKPPLTKKQIKRKKQLQKKHLQKETTSQVVDVPIITTAGAAVKSTATTMESQDAPTVMLSKRQKRNQKLAKKSGDDMSHKAKAHKRRKPQVGTKVLINGQEVEIMQFDGFPVLKQDADNLTELRKQMAANGISEWEIRMTMKMERRKAEKALAREKKKVCFHCRQSGHNLSECPELGDGSTQDVPASGICFKCGSTEHTHFECRVNRGQEFRFAKCFICQEQGHISRQCPDNPRGLYPKGGGCKVCGDVTHLKKDCPDLITKKEEHNITLEMASGTNLELLDEDIKKEETKPLVHNPKNKVVKF